MSTGNEIEVTIERIVHGGYGLARNNGMVCFITNTLPGERVRAHIVEKKKTFIVAKPIVVLEQSRMRVEPRCTLFEKCGGCNFQHIRYDYQLAVKKEIVEDCFHRIAKLREVNVPLPVSAVHYYNYRSRASLKADVIEGRARIGYYRHKTHDLVSITTCPVLTKKLNGALERCVTFCKTTPSAIRNGATIELLSCSDSEDVSVSLVPKGSYKRCTFVYNHTSAALSKQKAELYDSIDGIRFIKSPLNFYQAHYDQNINLVTIIKQSLGPLEGRNILELYAGSGNFSLTLASCGANVDAVESNSRSVREARRSSDINNITGCTFTHGDVSDYMRTRTACYDTVLLNPPRNGCSSELVNAVAGVRPQSIVYVSCDPSTLARDTARFIKNGYNLKKIFTVDMFPQTFHIESVAFFYAA